MGMGVRRGSGRQRKRGHLLPSTMADMFLEAIRRLRLADAVTAELSAHEPSNSCSPDALGQHAVRLIACRGGGSWGSKRFSATCRRTASKI